jgi:hypothetical protein
MNSGIIAESNLMKTLKFRKTLSELILKGEKTATWRLFDDKNLKEGDEIVLVGGRLAKNLQREIYNITREKIKRVEEKF